MLLRKCFSLVKNLFENDDGIVFRLQKRQCSNFLPHLTIKPMDYIMKQLFHAFYRLQPLATFNKASPYLQQIFSIVHRKKKEEHDLTVYNCHMSCCTDVTVNCSPLIDN